MTGYVALLRAVNVGGTGRLAMADLKAMCVAEGFEDVATYIASGNVVFRTDASQAEVKAALGARLETYAGKPVGVLVRTAQQFAALARANPFPDSPPNTTYAIFLDAPPLADALERVRNRTDEEIRLGEREIYVACPSGMGRSKLKIPDAAEGTARNMKTVATLATMAGAL